MCGEPMRYRVAVGIATVALLGSTGVSASAGTSTATLPGRPLYVTNRESHTIGVFTAREGRLTPVGEPVATGQLPRGMVLTHDGRFLYAASYQANALSAYAVGPDGGLAPHVAPNTVGTGSYSLAITPDGDSVYVNNPREGTVEAFTVGSDGVLAPAGTPTSSGAAGSRGLIVTPDGRFLYISHGDPTIEQAGFVTGFAIGADHNLTPLGPAIPTGTSAGTMSISPDGRYLYVPVQRSNQIFMFRIGADGVLGALPGSPLSHPGEPVGTIVTPDGRFLYVTNTTGNSVSAFAIRADGTLTLRSAYPTGDTPSSAAVSPDGRYLYVANFGIGNPPTNPGSVSTYAIGADGGLREVAGSPFRTGGFAPGFRSLAVMPNQGPTAAFSSYPRPGGRAVVFDASGSSDRDGAVARYDWDFGDGTIRPDAGPFPRHTYRNPGVYPVTLTVTDNEGCAARLVYTGYSALCTGSLAAIARHTVIVKDEG
ncbi:beta-propeller fold lactonase family protein [Actinomycetes bacterium KLBMP 9797]